MTHAKLTYEQLKRRLKKAEQLLATLRLARGVPTPGSDPQPSQADLFPAIVQTAMDGFWIVDDKGRFLEANAAYCDLVGYSRDELLGMAITDIEAAESPEETARHIEKVRAVGRDRFRTRHRRKDGTPVDVEVSTQYLPGRDLFCVFVRDVTSLVREAEALRVARDILRREASDRAAEGALLWTAVEQLPVSIVLTDMQGHIEYVNPAFTRITGYLPEEVIGSNPRVLKSGVQDAGFYQDLWGTILAGRVWRREVVNRRKDGEHYVQELTVAPVRDDQGRVSRFVAIGHDVTEHRQLRESLEFTQFAVDHATDMVLWVDGEGRFTYANESALRGLGYPRQELLRLLLWEVSGSIRPEGWGEIWQGTRRAGSVRMEDEVRRQDGSSFPADVVVTHVQFGAKEFQCAIVRDISERKRAEEAVRESTRVLLESQHVARLGSYRTDLVSGTWTGSGVLDEIFGIADPAFRRDVPAWLTIVHPDQRAEMAAYFAEEVLGKRQRFDREYRIVRLSDGEDRWVHGLGELVADREGRLVELIGTIQDITERKRAETALRESEEKYRAVVDEMNDGLFELDEEGTFRFANRALALVHGFDHPDQLLGRKVLDFVTPAGREEAAHRLRARMEGVPGPEFVEVPILRADGAEAILEIRPTPLVREGKIVGSRGVVRDVTQRKRLEHQFRQAQKMESIGRLAGGVAHDFNNLLTVILGETELAIAELEAGHPGHSGLGEVLKSAKRAEDLTRQLLAFSRQQLIAPTTFNLNNLVAGVDKMLRRLIGEDIDLVTWAAADLGVVNADRGQIEQVVMNLAVNARDAMPDGGKLSIETANVTLDEDYVRTHPYVPPGEYVLLVVSDSGQGMSQEVQSQIFEPFFTTKEQGKGTGLGLATCYGIVKQAGGHISAYSEVGVGTAMKVYLPRVRGLPDAPAGGGPAKAVVLHGTETILLVEDEASVRGIVARMLEAQGYTLLPASTGEEAIRLLETRPDPVHLLLTDVVLPGINGRVLAERAQALRPGLRVLYMSGYTGDVALRHQLVEQGAWLVQKPFTVEVLGRKVREVLDGEAPA